MHAAIEQSRGGDWTRAAFWLAWSWAALSSRLRDEAELDCLGTWITSEVRETLLPARYSLCLREIGHHPLGRTRA